MEKLFPSVLQAVAGDEYNVYAYMNDGSVRMMDIRERIGFNGVFAPLIDREFFVKRLTVINDTVAWDMTGDRDPYKCVDIDPFSFMEMPIVDDPLAVRGM
jgi:hypothetical protein